MKIKFNENILKSFDEFEEMFTYTGMAFANMGEEGKILSSDADEIVDKLEDIHKSFINWKKDVVYILVDNAIIEAKEKQEEKEVHEEEE